MQQQDERKNEKSFKTFGKKIDNFVAELNEAAQKLEAEFEDKYRELKMSAERLKKEAEDKDRWKEVETSLKKAGEELKNAFNEAFRKKNK
ncbi:MAG TPA: hypothetical protein VD927_05705 [Chryseosolibacter sp.]|nr:hypothetical protein [Chryseosolibacter sp.]